MNQGHIEQYDGERRDCIVFHLGSGGDNDSFFSSNLLKSVLCTAHSFEEEKKFVFFLPETQTRCREEVCDISLKIWHTGKEDLVDVMLLRPAANICNTFFHVG